MKICTIVGARPQFIKAAVLFRILRKSHKEILIHTGQHYDKNMSEVFFEQLNIPAPDYNLGISGGTHGSMTGKMLSSIEHVLIEEKPDMVLVYGDTNSTLAGALAGVKLHIPICHIEAGVRMGTFVNPEEVNRILCDRISSLLMCCTQTAVENLSKEGIYNGVYNPGDLMYDAVLYYSDQLKSIKLENLLELGGTYFSIPEDFYLLTCHREENTFSDEPLFEILSAMNSLEYKTIYPVHPRNRERASILVQKYSMDNIVLIEPVDYLTSLYLIKNSIKIVTDSGGLQREAWFLGKQCVTLLEQAPWPETFGGNMNQLCEAKTQTILEKICITGVQEGNYKPFGDGKAGEKICRLIEEFIVSRRG